MKMKKFYFIGALLATSLSFGQVILTEDFNYTVLEISVEMVTLRLPYLTIGRLIVIPLETQER